MNEWIQGIPSVEQVHRHEKEHGGNWIERGTHPTPLFMRLHVGNVPTIVEPTWIILRTALDNLKVEPDAPAS